MPRKAPAIAVSALLLGGALHAQPRPETGPCQRECLEGFVNQYLAAMVAHDPSRLQVTPDVKFTEDDVALKLGEALWQTASGLGTYKLYIADPEAGQVAFLGTIRENGTPAALALRLKVDNRKIAEVETVVVRNLNTAQNLEKLSRPDPVFLETAPAAARLPRAEMIASANKYFEAIEQGNGDAAPFDEKCNRVENGTQTTNNPELRMNPNADWNPMALGCRDQLNTKIFNYIRKIYPRRFLVIDEERQLVFGFFMFNHPGNVLSAESPGHGIYKMPAAAVRPFSVDVAELFKLQNGKIRKVEALMTSLPYGMKSPYVTDK